MRESMQNRLPILSFVVVLGGTAALLATTAESQVGPPKQYVALQPTSPGTSQSGNVNVSGRITSGQLVTGSFTLSGGSSGLVLTSNGSGVGTWQTPFIQAPYAMSGSFSASIFSATNSGAGNAIFGMSTGLSSSAIRGQSTAVIGIGVSGEASGDNSIGVVGSHTAESGTGAGVEGTTTSAFGTGVRGRNGNAAFGNAVEGIADGQAGYGVYGFSNNATGTGRGVYGRAIAPSATGVYGAHDANGRGVYGTAFGTSGTGVYGRVDTASSGQEAFAIRGLGLGQTAYGGFFEGSTGVYATTLNSGYAGIFVGAVQVTGNMAIGSLAGSERLRIFGNTADVQSITNTGGGRGLFVSTNSDTGIWTNTSTGFAGLDARTASSGGYGVYGVNSNSSGSGSGVVGQTAAGSGWGVYSIGNMGASGVKPFRIDHPLDPENKYLLHYSTESPTPQNFYSGNVTTDKNGKAWVDLPDYFAEINANFKYQLTVLDDSESDGFVQVKVGRKIQGARFLIMTSAPNVEVSWRVEADRNDRWVRQNGAPTEREKPDELKGLYQHPELYGMPPAKGEMHSKLNAKKPGSTPN